MLKIGNDFMASIREAQKLDVKLVDLMGGIDQSENKDFEIDAQNVLSSRRTFGVVCRRSWVRS